MSKFIVVMGDVVDGLRFYGPFSDSDEAGEFAEGERCGNEPWTCAELYDPMVDSEAE